MKNKIIILVFACTLFSCNPTLYIPASSDIKEQQQLLSGRKLYVDHCSSCHNLHFPKEYDTEGWKKELDKMQMKAKITEDEKQLIFEYLISQP